LIISTDSFFKQCPSELYTTSVYGFFNIHLLQMKHYAYSAILASKFNQLSMNIQFAKALLPTTKYSLSY